MGSRGGATGGGSRAQSGNARPSVSAQRRGVQATRRSGGVQAQRRRNRGQA